MYGELWSEMYIFKELQNDVHCINILNHKTCKQMLVCLYI